MAEVSGYETPSAYSDDDFQPPPSKKRKTPKNSKKEDTRFCSPGKNMEEYEKPFCLGNTKVNMCWALKNFNDW